MSDTNNKKPNITPLVNKIEASGLIVLDLSELFPQTEVIEFDITAFLDRGILLREQAFREQLSSHSWEQYRHSHVAVFCSSQALIQPWAWMLIQSYLTEVEAIAHYADPTTSQEQILFQQIHEFDYSQFQEKRIMLKGCGADYITGAVYGEFSKHVIPLAKSVMFGEPCSSVPVYKRKRK